MSFIGNLPIRSKISLLSASLVIFACGGIAAGIHLITSGDIRETAFARLEATAVIRKAELENYLENIRSDIRIFADSPIVIQATKDFTDAWNQLPSGEQTHYLQQSYIENNPYPLGQKDMLDQAGVEYYDTLHGALHPWFRLFLKEKGYYDIFLFDLDGNLIYSVFKENDYATNLLTGIWKDTDLGNAFRSAQESSQKQSIHFFDFRPYGPSYDAPASFISTPVYEGDQKIGVTVFQMPIDEINEIMTHSSGLGQTGETLIVGQDGLLRNDSPFSEENDILSSQIMSEAITRSFEGHNTTDQSSDYRGVELKVAATLLEFENTLWSVAAVQETEEIFASINAILDKVSISTAVWILVAIFMSLYFSRSITNPLKKLEFFVNKLAEGNTSLVLDTGNRTDEIGKMGRATIILRDNIIKRIDSEKETLAKEHQAHVEAENKNKEMQKNIRVFEKHIEKTLQSISESMGNMRDTSKALFENSLERKKIVAQTAEQTQENSTNTQTVASAAEELSTSIAEISQQINRVSGDITEATRNTKAANDQVSTLDQSARNIGNVTMIIQDIAEQTNLLALNATIEAARAGDAGKGFAVVASEVKDLAGQTANATENISSQITSIQESTSTAVEVIKSISESMGEISGYVTAIQTSIEAQDTSTKDISRSIQKAADGTKAILSDMGKNQNAIEYASQSAGQANTAAENVTDQVDILKETVTSFIKQVKAVA